MSQPNGVTEMTNVAFHYKPVSDEKIALAIVLVLLGLFGFIFVKNGSDRRVETKLNDPTPQHLLVTVSQVRSHRFGAEAMGAYMVAIKNTSNITYRNTHWSCVMFRGDKAVGEELVMASAVLANEVTYTESKAVIASEVFDNVKCRLTWWSKSN
jgi:hypothetical protein